MTSLIAVAGDWHGNTSWGLRMIERAHSMGCRTLLHLGDYGIDWPGVKRGRYDRLLDEAAALRGMVIVVVPGNHENWDTIDAVVASKNAHEIFAHWRPNTVIVPRGARWTWSGVRFGALPGAFSIDYEGRLEGKGWWPQEDVRAEDVETLGTDPLDILVAHDTPAGYAPIDILGSPYSLRRDLEERSLASREHIRTAVENTHPRLVLHGHWHYRWSTMMGDTRIQGLGADDDEGNFGVLDLSEPDLVVR